MLRWGRTPLRPHRVRGLQRLDGVLRVLIVVVATFLLTEWVHYRLGTPPVFQFLLGGVGDSEVARGHDPNAVTESEFQTYLHVLEAMQTNRSLSIDDAVEAEHLPLEKIPRARAARTAQRGVDRTDPKRATRAGRDALEIVDPPRDHG